MNSHLTGADEQNPVVPLRDGSAVRSRPEQIPAVPGDVDEDDDLSVLLLPRLGDELNAQAAHACVCRLEVVDPQEQPDASRELISNRT